MTKGHTRYIPYTKAFDALSARLDPPPTPEEVAAWVWLRSKDGGLDAFLNALNANELDPPRMFFYDPGNGKDFDYVAPLMGCWFREADIDAFTPIDRFLKGQALIERWRKVPGVVDPEALIRAKITESRLQDFHPIMGGTQGSSHLDDSFPALEEALFAVSEVEHIEAEELTGRTSASSPQLGLQEWLSARGKHAADVKHSQANGSRDKQEKIRAIWMTGKYSTRERCAEEESGALGMSFSAARKALRNTPDPDST